MSYLPVEQWAPVKNSPVEQSSVKKLPASSISVENRLNNIRSVIQKAGYIMTKNQLKVLYNSRFLLLKPPAPGRQRSIKTLLDLVDYIGQIEPRQRSVQDLIYALYETGSYESAIILEGTFDSVSPITSSTSSSSLPTTTSSLINPTPTSTSSLINPTPTSTSSSSLPTSTSSLINPTPTLTSSLINPTPTSTSSLINPTSFPISTTISSLPTAIPISLLFSTSAHPTHTTPTSTSTTSTSTSTSSPLPISTPDTSLEQTALECGICFHEYTPDGNLRPMIFAPCGHGYCLGCSQGITKTTIGFICPYCKDECIMMFPNHPIMNFLRPQK